MKVTKKTIIHALKTEPLIAGYFLQKDGCGVCAVGAVLRHSDFKYKTNFDKMTNKGFSVCKNKYAESIHDDRDNNYIYYSNSSRRQRKLIKDFFTKMAKYNKLGSLSSFFENLAEGYFDIETNKWHPNGLRTTRRLLVEFVNKNFPNTVNL